MQAQIIRLTFRTPLHTGRRGIGIEETDHRLAADTLFAALLTQLAQRDAQLVPVLAEQFPRRQGDNFTAGDAPFLLSSTFPFVGDVLLLPAPVLPQAGVTGFSKELKKVKYVSEEIFRALLDGTPLHQFADSAHRLQAGKVWVSREELDQIPTEMRADDKTDIWHEQRRPRVAVDRVQSRSAIFHHGQVFFREGCGLWFGIVWRDVSRQIGTQPLDALFQILLDDLSITGIGGLRSYGLGAFEYTNEKTLDLPDVRDGTAVTLSRFHPAPADLPQMEADAASYRLIQVGGWMRSSGRPDERRKAVTMIEEGAVLGTEGSTGGCLVDVSPPNASHPSWRYGLLFPAGLSRKG